MPTDGLGDWRLWGAARLGSFFISPAGVPHYPGEPIHVAGTISLPGGPVSLPWPHPTALALSQCRKSADRAADLYAMLVKVIPRKGRPVAKSVADDHIGLLFDYFEEYFASAMFACAAIDAYCNMVICQHPNDPVVNRSEDGNSASKQVKANPEFEPLDTKVREILPAILNMNDPGRLAWYSQFSKMKKLRDDVTHFKFKHQIVGTEPNTETPFYRAWNGNARQHETTVCNCVKYFERGASPRWLGEPAGTS